MVLTAAKAVDVDRARAVARVLSYVPIEAIEVLELRDPQYLAVKRVAEVLGEKGLALVVGNALVSYRLSSRGEDYWLEFSEAVTSYYKQVKPESPSSVIKFFEWFLPHSRGNRSLSSQKVSRLKRAYKLLELIIGNPLGFSNLEELHKLITSTLKSKPYEKTIVFAVKMAYYFFKALGVRVHVSENIPLPIDKRIALLTSTSRMVYSPPQRILARPEPAVEAWRIVSKESGIPSIHLDALVWLPSAGIEPIARYDIERAREVFAENLISYLGRAIPLSLARAIADELLYAPPI